jgi:hypothetical protein
MGQRRVRRGKKNYEPLLGCASPESPLGRICGESARRPRNPPRLNRPSAHCLPLRCCLTSLTATITCYDCSLPWGLSRAAGASQRASSSATSGRRVGPSQKRTSKQSSQKLHCASLDSLDAALKYVHGMLVDEGPLLSTPPVWRNHHADMGAVSKHLVCRTQPLHTKHWYQVYGATVKIIFLALSRLAHRVPRLVRRSTHSWPLYGAQLTKQPTAPFQM